MLYLVACLNETLQHNNQWTNKCMQRNDRPCCSNIHNTHLNPTAHIRDNNVSTASESYILMKGFRTQKHSIYKLMTMSDSHLILSYSQLVNMQGRISATMLKYHAINANRTVVLHSHNLSIKKWMVSFTLIWLTSSNQWIWKWLHSTVWMLWQNEKSLPLVRIKPTQLLSDFMYVKTGW